MPKRIKENHVVAGDSPAAFEFDLVMLLSQSDATRASVALAGAGESPAATQAAPTHFANTMADGARLLVAETVLLGSPPVDWLIWNLVMFLED